jgi:S1-C subfamily serine protease
VDFVHHYEATLGGWLEAARKLDPGNRGGDLEAVFAAVWTARLAAAARSDDSDRVAEVVKQLDGWKQKQKFQDADRAATLHLYAARALVLAERSSAASQYIEDGLAYKPPNRMIREQLQRGAQAIEGVGAGTGFVVGADGYILTNHHVIEGPGKTLVQLTADAKVRVPARVITMDVDGDMALLKVDIPEGIELKPLPISTARVRRGAAVGAFGYPGGGAVGTGLKITTGVVSSLPADTPEGMVLLDCTVNPGNSGGPLCDSYGNVIGMVTAKSLSSYDTESYGMALPADKLKKFLTLHLPKASQPPPAKTLDERLPWDEINDRVEKSVLMIVRRM